jgi:hypothetical protein
MSVAASSIEYFVIYGETPLEASAYSIIVKNHTYSVSDSREIYTHDRSPSVSYNALSPPQSSYQALVLQLGFFQLGRLDFGYLHPS